MSTTIDQRVVEMQFDNKHFERNVSTTMSTLDKLKQKLHLDGATRGLENVNSAAKKVDMTGLGSAVDTVQAKFSAMQVIGVTALANITNSAVNAGKRIVSALTIDPVKTGFQEYETQINAVQTILANTESKGTTINDVNNALDQLNKYADKTIYNFTEMTRNIGTFTAAGVDLDTSVNAIQGIANLAAVSGSTSQQASTAMYQLSQALSSGTVKLMDWNSVVNAGMGGQVFQDALKETARVHGVAIDSMIAEQGSFRETLSEGWLTADILTETLSKFTMATEGATEAEIKANREKLKSLGYTDEQIEGIFKLGNTATNAATKVKTFTQLWDVLKESAQSGWAQTWKIIIGDFEEAKSLLTPIADALTGMINKFSNFRNGILEKVFGGGGGKSKWKSLIDSMDKAGLSSDKLKKASELLTGASDGLNKSLDKTSTYTVKKGDYLYKIAKEYGTTWQEIYKLNKDIIDDPDLIYPNQVLKMPEVFSEMAKGVSELTDEQLKSAGYTKEQIAAYRELEKAAKESGMTVEEFIASLSEPMSGRDLLFGSFENIGKTFAGIGKAIKTAWEDIFGLPDADKIAAGIYRALEALYKFSEAIRLTDADGKLNENGQKLMRTFKGIFAAIDIVVTIIGGPLKIALKIVKQLLGAFGFNILDVTAFIGDMIVKVRDWIDGFLDFSGVFAKIVGPVKNAVKAFKGWIDTLKKSENLPQDIAKGIASGFGKAWTFIKNLFSSIRNIFTNGFDSISDSPISGFLSKIVGGLKVAGQTIVELGKIVLEKVNNFLSARGFKTISLDAISGLVSGFKNGASKVWNTVATISTTIFQKVKEFLSSKKFNLISRDSIAGLVNGFKNGASKVWDAAVNMISTLVQKVKDFLGIHSPSTVFIAIGGFIIAGLVKGIIQGLPDVDGAMGDVVDTLKSIVSNIDLGSLFSAVATTGTLVAVNKFADMFRGVGDMASGLGDTLSGVGDFLKATASGVNKILKKSAKGIGQILTNTAKVIKSFSKVLNSIAFETKTEGIKNLAVALAILVGAIVVMTFLEPAELWNAVGVIAVLAAVLAALTLAMNKIDGAGATIDKTGLNIQGLKTGLVGIGIAILLLATAVKMLGNLDEDQAKQGFSYLAGIVLAIGTVFAAFGLLVKGKTAQNIDKFGKTMTKMGVALLLMVFVVKLLGGMDPSVLHQGGIAILVFSGIIVGLMAATKLLGNDKSIDKLGPTLLKIALALGIMAIVVKMLGGMDPSVLHQGGIAILVFSGIIVGLMAATKLLGNGKNIGDFGSALIKMALAIGVMGIVVKMIGGIPTEQAVQGVIAVAALAGVMIGLLFTLNYMSACCKDIDKLGKTLLYVAAAIGVLGAVVVVLGRIPFAEALQGVFFATLLAGVMVGLIFALNYVSACCKDIDKLGKSLLYVAGAIAILGVVAVLLGLVPTDTLVKGTIVVGFLSLFMAGLILATSKAKDCMGNLIALTAAIAVLAAALWILSTIEAKELGNAMVALGIVIGMFALLVLASGAAKGSIGTLIAMTLAIGLLGGILYLLATNASGTDAINSALGLAVLLGAMVVVIALLGVIQPQANKAWSAAGVMLILCGALLGFVGVLWLMSNVKNALDNAKALGVLLGVMVIVIALLGFIEPQANKAWSAVGVMLILSITLLAFVGVLYMMSNINNALGNAIALGVLLGAMVIVIGILGKMSATAMQAAAGVVAMLGIAASLVVLALALSMLGGLTWGELAKGLIAIGGAFAILGVAAFVLAPVAPIMLALAAALLVLGLSVVATGAGLQLLATGMTALAAVFSGGAVETITAGFAAMLKSLITLVPLIGQLVATGIITLCSTIIAVAPAVATALVTVLATILTTLATFAPTIFTAIASIIASMTQFLVPKLVELAVTLITSFLEAGITLIPLVVEFAVTLISNLLAGIVTLIPQIVATGIAVVTALLEGLMVCIPMVVDAGLKIIISVLKAIGDNIGEMAKMAVRIITEFINGIAESIPSIIQAGFNLIISFINGLAEAIENNTDPLISAVNRLMDAVINAIKKWFANFVSRGKDLVSKLGEGIKNKVKDATDAIKNVVTKIVDKVKEAWKDLKEAGKHIIDGFIKGIKDKISAVGDAAKSIGKKAKDAVKNFLGIKSPSREFIKLGGYTTEGFIKGLGMYSKRLVYAAEDIGASAIDPVRNAISNIATLLNSDIDTQPTIRPILDLTNVRAGASRIGGLLNTDSSIGVVANVNRISGMMHGYRQNGGNDDVVSAINKLSARMDNLERPSYNINGITYDDGSNIAMAMETIARAALRERRT